MNRLLIPSLLLAGASLGCLAAGVAAAVTAASQDPVLTNAWLGIRGCDRFEGIEVQEVMMGSAAEAAGIRAKDVILRLNGLYLSSAKYTRKIVREMKPGDPVAFSIRRDKTILEVQGFLEAKPTDELKKGQLCHLPMSLSFQASRQELEPMGPIPVPDPDCQKVDSCIVQVSPCEPLMFEASSDSRTVLSYHGRSLQIVGDWRGRVYLDQERCLIEANLDCGVEL